VIEIQSKTAQKKEGKVQSWHSGQRDVVVCGAGRDADISKLLQYATNVPRVRPAMRSCQLCLVVDPIPSEEEKKKGKKRPT
jgi:hypothetical protein